MYSEYFLKIKAEYNNNDSRTIPLNMLNVIIIMKNKRINKNIPKYTAADSCH